PVAALPPRAGDVRRALLRSRRPRAHRGGVRAAPRPVAAVRGRPRVRAEPHGPPGARARPLRELDRSAPARRQRSADRLPLRSLQRAVGSRLPSVDDTPVNVAAEILRRGDDAAVELRQRVHQLAAALGRLGIQEEQRVLVVLTDCPEYVYAFLGAIWAGAVPVLVTSFL